MRNYFNSKFFLIIGLILIIVGIFYIAGLKNPRTTPYQTLTPGSYPAGTTVSLYKDAPSSFPKEIILENKTLEYAGAVKTPDGKTQTKVSYKSDKKVPDVLAMYKEFLPKIGWKVSVKLGSARVAVLETTKGEQKILVTMAIIKENGTAKDIGTLVTFQYESR
jgi:hypothetical protein